MMSSTALPACRHVTVDEDNDEPEGRQGLSNWQTLKEATCEFLATFDQWQSCHLLANLWQPNGKACVDLWEYGNLVQEGGDLVAIYLFKNILW